MKAVYQRSFRPGTAIQTGIRFVAQAMPAGMRARVVNCPGCKRRANTIDRVTAKLFGRNDP